MPTVGWILEDAIDRFWEAQPLRLPAEPPPQIFVCRQCLQTFSSSTDLRRHYNLKHPLELPGLSVRGELLLTETAIRSPVPIGAIELMQCTGCEVQIDGGSWAKLSESEFKTAFSRARSASWNVRLINDRADDASQTRELYRVQFRIPKTSDLNAVDERFVALLVKEELTHDDLAQFQTRLPEEVAAREYGAALGNYALGILLKERRSAPHSHVRFEEFADRMRASLAVLGAFERPVAMAVSGSIRFNLNEFQRNGAAIGTEVEIGLRYFARIIGAFSGDPAPRAGASAHRPASRRAICPLDHVSHKILEFCSLAPGPTALSDLDRLFELAHGQLPVSEQDLAKVHVLCAQGYLRLRRLADAKRHLNAIQFHPVFKDWAQGQLDGIAFNG